MENEWLKRLNERDECVLSEIEKSYGKMIYSLAFRILGSKEDAKECVNDVLLEIWNTVPPKQPEKISAYACMLTRRTAIDTLRKNSAEKRGGSEYMAAVEELEEAIYSSDTVEAEVESMEISSVLNDFVVALGAKDRNIFLSRYYAFEGITEIAEKLGMGKNAVNIRLSRMRKELRSLFEERNIYI